MADDKKRYLKVEGHSYLVRDTMSNAIINQNQAEYDQYKQLRKIKDKERIDLYSRAKKYYTVS